MKSVYMAVIMGFNEKSHDGYQFAKSHKVSHDERNVMHNQDPAFIDSIDVSKWKETFEVQVIIPTSRLTYRISWLTVESQASFWRQIRPGSAEHGTWQR